MHGEQFAWDGSALVGEPVGKIGAGEQLKDERRSMVKLDFRPDQRSEGGAVETIRVCEVDSLRPPA